MYNNEEKKYPQFHYVQDHPNVGITAVNNNEGGFFNPYSSLTPDQLNSIGYLQEQERVKHDRQISEAMQMSRIRVQEKAEIERIWTQESEVRLKIRADVLSLRELQKTEVLISSTGEVFLRREMFGEDAKDRAHFCISARPALLVRRDSSEKVLLATISVGGQQKALYVDLSATMEKEIRREFDRVGISFRLSKTRESELRMRLVEKLLSMAERFVLPEQHGFEKVGKQIRFSFPENLSWKEVRQHVGEKNY